MTLYSFLCCKKEHRRKIHPREADHFNSFSAAKKKKKKKAPAQKKPVPKEADDSVPTMTDPEDLEGADKILTTLEL